MIRVENISKLYKLGAARHDSVRDALAGFLRGRGGRETENDLWALRDVSFEVAEGETVGIVGRNGAGKSTLLKILSRITRPTSGRVSIAGRVGSLLEVGTGFHQELSGRENIYLNGAILGMKRAEIASKFDEIVEFSEIGRFLDTPVKNYSSGMYMRLAFSVAAHLDPEVLIVDEVLAVGDVEFQRKCIGKMNEVSRTGRTVLFVSHNLGSLSQICSRGILLERGQLIFSGPIEDTVNEYLRMSRAAPAYKIDAKDPAKPMQFVSAMLTKENGQPSNEFAHDEPIVLEFEADFERIRRGAMFCVAVLNKHKERVFSELRPVEEIESSNDSKVRMRYRIPGEFIAPNSYSVLLQIFLPSGEMVDHLADVCPFTVIDAGTDLAPFPNHGVVQFHGDWERIG